MTSDTPLCVFCSRNLEREPGYYVVPPTHEPFTECWICERCWSIAASLIGDVLRALP